jgi:hypothetical protein
VLFWQAIRSAEGTEMIWIGAAISVGVVALATAAFSYLRVLRELEKEAFSDRQDASIS